MRRLGTLLLITAALGCGKAANTRCTGVTCTGGLTCDPADGLCKCGGEGGLVCAQGQVCDSKHLACVDPAIACEQVTCEGNTACDPADGQCKCGGSGGPVCAAGEICDPATRHCSSGTACTGVVCSGREVCDPTDAVCKCDGQVCGAGQICADTDGGGCIASPCAGVHCTGSTTCDPADGQCKCGGAGGPFCGAGETCACTAVGADGGCDAASRACEGSTLCASVTCTGGTVCDPADGVCKCGRGEDGGAGGNICGSGQSCDPAVGACIGGDRCRDVVCPGGTSCDPEDGQCKCGGQGGQVCGQDQSCFQLQNGNACRTGCDPLMQNCPPNQACFFDESAIAATGYCAPPGTKTDLGNPPPLCNGPADCAQGYNCEPEVGRDFPGTCHRYCDTKQGANGCTNSDVCVQVGNGAPVGLGQCKPQS